MIIFIAASLLGLGFSSVLPKDIPAPLRILASFAIGLLVFTQIVLLLAFFLNISLVTIIISLILCGCLSAFLFFKEKNRLFSDFKISIVFAVSSLIILSLSAYIFFTQVLAEKNFGLVTGGGGIYGDTALHLAYTSRIGLGLFPVENPLFAGRTLVYPLANDLLSAVLRIGSLNLNLSFALPQIVFFLGFLSLFFAFCRKFMGERGYVFTLVILFLGWGIGWLLFIKEWSGVGGSFWNLISKDFTNNDFYNLYFHNILTGLIWPERSFLPGILLAIWSFINFLAYEKTFEKKYILINGLILGCLPFWHTHTFIFMVISTITVYSWYLFRYFSKKIVFDVLFTSVIAIFLSVPFLLLFLNNHEASNFLHFSRGWISSGNNFFVFWFRNSFLVIPFAIAGIIFLNKKSLYLFVPAFITFLIANFVIFQPWDWDNIKLLTLSFMFFSILAGIFLERLSKSNFWTFAAVAIIIPFFALSGLLSILLQTKNIYTIYDRTDIDLANWAKKYTSPNDVFIIEPIPNHPIPGLAGRLVYMGYPGHLWVHGIDYASREENNNKILSGDIKNILSMDSPISYIVVRNNAKNVFIGPETFSNEKYKVFRASDLR